MNTLHQVFRVEFRYPVHFTRGIFDSENQLLRDVVALTGARRKVAFVVDEGVCHASRQLLLNLAEYCRLNSDFIDLVCAPLIVPGSERVKNAEQYVDTVRAMVNAGGICRHSFIVAIGGGAVLDMTGYAAATSHRGVRLIRVPTTVLAQNDSGVGVKNSVNRFGKKNFLGSFTPPHAVINDFEFLDTLPDRDWRSGMAEAVKVSLIKDAAFFKRIEEEAPALVQRNAKAMERLIYHCAELHLNHIAGNDPFEKGSSRPLDFGHWAAHKLEQLTSYRLRHGEAVAAGIALDTTYSYLTGLLSHSEWLRVISLLVRLGLPVWVPEMEDLALLDGLIEFREHLGGELTVMLLEAIGTGIEVHEMKHKTIRESVMLLAECERQHRCVRTA